MTNPITPEEMDRLAERFEETARSLRVSAAALRGVGSVQSVPGNPSLLYPAYTYTPPQVLQTAEKVLRQVGRPMHIKDLLDAVRSGGAFIKDQANLSSMLSKDDKRTFRTVANRRGFWELVPSRSSTPNLSTHQNVGA